MRVLADTSPGYHDLLIAACGPARYAQLGVEGRHPNCAENLGPGAGWPGRHPRVHAAALQCLHATLANPDGSISWLLAESRTGDRFEMLAEMDLTVVLSACPSELSGINAGELSDLAIEIDDP